MNKKIRKQLIMVNLHKLFMTLHVCEGFMANSLLQDMVEYLIITLMITGLMEDKNNQTVPLKINNQTNCFAE